MVSTLRSWPLRLRIFLFFAFLSVAGAAVALLGLWLAFSRVDATGVRAAFVLAAVIIPFGLVALTVGIWVLFDAYVARPINLLAAGLRARTQVGPEARLERDQAKYLGDLAPAADAVTRALGEANVDTARAVALETARLEASTQRLSDVLSQIPVATILLSADNRIVLYDGQAGARLAEVAPPRLWAPIGDYLDLPESAEGASWAIDRNGNSLRVQRLRMEGGGALLVLPETACDGEGALVYDFDLFDARPMADLMQTPLDRLSYCVVDTETTGLDPAKEALVQVAAVRVVNGRVRDDETLESYVAPGRPIPSAATAVHRISDATVHGAPAPRAAVAQMRKFCGDDVLVAHNAPFDLTLLRAAGDDPWTVPVVDTVLLSAVLWGTTAHHTLDALCARLGVVIPSDLRHTALGDAQATAAALVHLIPMLQARGFDTLGQLLKETRRHGRLLQDMNPV